MNGIGCIFFESGTGTQGFEIFSLICNTVKSSRKGDNREMLNRLENKYIWRSQRVKRGRCSLNNSMKSWKLSKKK